MLIFYRAQKNPSTDFDAVFDDFCVDIVQPTIFENHHTICLTELHEKFKDFAEQKDLDVSSYK